MGGFTHLVLVKFKEDAAVEDILKEMTKLASEMDTVKSFEWGKDVGITEALTHGFTHAFVLTFDSAEDFTAYASHPSHLEFAANTFTGALEKVLLFDFPPIAAKP